MKKVVSGIVDFQNNTFKKHASLFAELATQQSPEVLFITCADSRIDPNLVTQTKPGDLFICRNAGNIVPPHTRNAGGVTASIEYAVEVLGVQDIVVCGHTDCGAMKGAMNLDAVAHLPHVHDWLDHARAAVDTVNYRASNQDQESDADSALLNVIRENVLLQLQHLRTHPAVAARVNCGEIELHGWVYDIETGAVTCLDETSHQFVPLQERYASLLSGKATSGT